MVGASLFWAFSYEIVNKIGYIFLVCLGTDHKVRLDNIVFVRKCNMLTFITLISSECRQTYVKASFDLDSLSTSYILMQNSFSFCFCIGFVWCLMIRTMQFQTFESTGQQRKQKQSWNPYHMDFSISLWQLFKTPHNNQIEEDTSLCFLFTVRDY